MSGSALYLDGLPVPLSPSSYHPEDDHEEAEAPWPPPDDEGFVEGRIEVTLSGGSVDDLFEALLDHAASKPPPVFVVRAPDGSPLGEFRPTPSSRGGRVVPGTIGRAVAFPDGHVEIDGRAAPGKLRPNGYLAQWFPGRGTLHLHRAVCEAFHGERPDDDHEVDHVNRDRLDNRPDNLRWLSREENRARRVNLSGEGHPFAVLTADDVRKIRALYSAGVSAPKIAKAWGVSRYTAHRAATRRTYSDVE